MSDMCGIRKFGAYERTRRVQCVFRQAAKLWAWGEVVRGLSGAFWRLHRRTCANVVLGLGFELLSNLCWVRNCLLSGVTGRMRCEWVAFRLHPFGRPCLTVQPESFPTSPDSLTSLNSPSPLNRPSCQLDPGERRRGARTPQCERPWPAFRQGKKSLG